MVPRVWQCDVWEIDGNQGTAYVPADAVGIARIDGVIDDRRVGKFADYYDGQTIYSATYRTGVWCARLSAPGYMDQTDVSVFETRAEAEAYLVETYDTEGK
jgi:hypothetical protein